METVDYFIDLATSADEIRVLAHLAPPVPLEAVIRDRVVAGELAVTFVIAGDCLDYVTGNAGRRARWRDILDSGGDIYRYDDPLPCNLHVFGEAVLIKQSAPGPVKESYGVPIESHDGTVREWAVDLIERHRVRATRVDADTFAEPIDGGDDAR